MAADAVLNIRLPRELKEHGNQVLEKSHTSVSKVVRDLYEYMEREQKIPECLVNQEEELLFQKRRKMLRDIAGTVDFPRVDDYKKLRDSYREERFGS